MPLWQRPHREVISELIQFGFRSKIVTVNLNLDMTVVDLGQILPLEYIVELEKRGIDPCDEGREFHTTVIDAPIFKQAIPVRAGEILYHTNYAFLPFELNNNAG